VRRIGVRPAALMIHAPPPQKGGIQ
jgi:hypothetical protein